MFLGSSQTTRGVYYFSGPDAPHYPGLHNLGSRNWTSDERDPPPPLGETDVVRRPYFKGNLEVPRPPAVLIGSADCIRDGDRLPLPVIDRTLPSGIDSRCYSLAPAPPIWGPAVWLRPEDLEGTADGAPVARWPDSGFRGNDVLNTDLATTPRFVLDVPINLWSVRFRQGLNLAWPTPVVLGNAHTLYIAARKSAVVFGSIYGPALRTGLVTPPQGSPDTRDTQTRYATDVESVTMVHAGNPPVDILMSARRSPSGVELRVGDESATIALNPAGTVTLRALTVVQSGTAGDRQCYVFEVLVFDRQVTDAEDSAVRSYFNGRYGV